MTKRERLLRAMNGEEVDRIPVAPRIWRYRETFRTPGGTLRNKIVRADAGSEYGISPSIERIEPLIKSAQDIDLLPYLLPEPQRVREHFAMMHAKKQEIGDEGILVYRPSLGVDHIVVEALGVQEALISSTNTAGSRDTASYT